MEIDCYLVRDVVNVGFVHTPYISTHDQLVDLFTKANGNGFKHTIPFLQWIGTVVKMFPLCRGSKLSTVDEHCVGILV